MSATYETGLWIEKKTTSRKKWCCALSHTAPLSSHGGTEQTFLQNSTRAAGSSAHLQRDSAREENRFFLKCLFLSFSAASCCPFYTHLPKNSDAPCSRCKKSAATPGRRRAPTDRVRLHVFFSSFFPLFFFFPSSFFFPFPFPFFSGSPMERARVSSSGVLV